MVAAAAGVQQERRRSFILKNVMIEPRRVKDGDVLVLGTSSGRSNYASSVPTRTSLNRRLTKFRTEEKRCGAVVANRYTARLLLLPNASSSAG